jgi:hypothetical protein
MANIINWMIWGGSIILIFGIVLFLYFFIKEKRNQKKMAMPPSPYQQPMQYSQQNPYAQHNMPLQMQQNQPMASQMQYQQPQYPIGAVRSGMNIPYPTPQFQQSQQQNEEMKLVMDRLEQMSRQIIGMQQPKEEIKEEFPKTVQKPYDYNIKMEEPSKIKIPSKKEDELLAVITLKTPFPFLADSEHGIRIKEFIESSIVKHFKALQKEIKKEDIHPEIEYDIY